MATPCGGIGKPLEKVSDLQETDVTIQDEYQVDINDSENIEPDHQAGLRDLNCEIEQLQQTVEANDNDPMDSISHLECKLNQLTLTLCHLHHWNPLRKFCINTQTLYALPKRKCLL